MLCGDDHFTNKCPCHEDINKFLKNKPTLVVLTDPFLSQQQFINHTSLHGPSSSTKYINMMFTEIVVLTTIIHTYDKIPKNKDEGSSFEKTPPINPSPPPPSNGPLTIEKPSFDTILRPPKSTIHKNIFNPSAQVAQFYNIVEYLSQVPCAMSTLEVLQIFSAYERICCHP